MSSSILDGTLGLKIMVFGLHISFIGIFVESAQIAFGGFIVSVIVLYVSLIALFAQLLND
ncbi:hypothetical protein [Natrinema amylolyticum]|uniref:hypothetical protein n=1 Tax=Natrinema amylolyticum TaxID=2878679 RepID=UPI001CF9A11B|nr:hypothetical protein [Natrinema amylolyticum]